MYSRNTAPRPTLATTALDPRGSSTAKVHFALPGDSVESARGAHLFLRRFSVSNETANSYRVEEPPGQVLRTTSRSVHGRISSTPNRLISRVGTTKSLYTNATPRIAVKTPTAMTAVRTARLRRLRLCTLSITVRSDRLSGTLRDDQTIANVKLLKLVQCAVPGKPRPIIEIPSKARETR